MPSEIIQNIKKRHMTLEERLASNPTRVKFMQERAAQRQAFQDKVDRIIKARLAEIEEEKRLKAELVQSIKTMLKEAEMQRDLSTDFFGGPATAESRTIKMGLWELKRKAEKW